MENINEVFSELDARIDKLKHYDDYISIWDTPNTNFNISKIERNIHYFENEASSRIEVSIRELMELEALGTVIISNLNVHDEWGFGGIPMETEMTVERKRQEVYNLITEEISFYINKLTILKSSLEEKLIQSQENQKYTITIGADFNFPQLKREKPEIIQTVLNKEQSALLFYYLMDKNLILAYDAKSISKIVSMLTAYSENTLRGEAFGNIHNIKKQTPSNSEKTHIEILKNALVEIIQEIDNTLQSAK